jgi:hypothetical protein
MPYRKLMKTFLVLIHFDLTSAGLPYPTLLSECGIWFLLDVNSLNTWNDSEGPFVRDALGYLDPSANLCY